MRSDAAGSSSAERASAALGGPRRAKGGSCAQDESEAGAARDGRARDAARVDIGAGCRALPGVIRSIGKALPDATFAGDSTQLVYAGYPLVEAPRLGAWFNSPAGPGTPGYASAAAIDAVLGGPTRSVVRLVARDDAARAPDGARGAQGRRRDARDGPDPRGDGADVPTGAVVSVPPFR